jgi:hypothetical protein
VGALLRIHPLVVETASDRPLSLSIEETDVLVRLLSDQLGRQWRYDRHPQDDVVQLHKKLVGFRASWSGNEREN